MKKRVLTYVRWGGLLIAFLGGIMAIIGNLITLVPNKINPFSSDDALKWGLMFFIGGTFFILLASAIADFID